MKKNLLIICFITLISLQSNAMSVQWNALSDACGEGIGWIEAQISGGVLPYTYSWSAGTVDTINPNIYSSRIIHLAAGAYTITVHDAVNDSVVATYTLNNVSTLDRNGYLSNGPYGITTNMNPVTGTGISFACPNMNNGAMYVLLSETQGAAPFVITNIIAPFPGTTAFLGTGIVGPYAGITNLASGDHWYLQLVDNLGCPGFFDDIENSSVPYSYNTISTLPSCNGQNNGSMYVYNYMNGAPFSPTVTLYDSISGSFVLSQTLTAFGNELLSNTLFPGTYHINMQANYTVTYCDTNFYVTVPDAGTNCGTISGTVYLDTIHNCVHDASEPFFPYQAVVLTPGPYYATTDASGVFSAMVPFGTYSGSQLSHSQNYFAVCNSGAATINVGTPNATINIGDSVNMQYDLSIGLTSTAARPGFNLHYGINIRNNSLITGTAPLVTLTVDPSLVFVSCSQPYTDLGGGVYTVQLGAISAFQSSGITFYFTVPSATSIGSVLMSNATVADVISENITENNFSHFNQTVIGSYDPNDKTVLPSNDPNNTFFIDIDSLLTYTIRFQNTGSDTAFNIHVVDSLSQWLDFSTLEIKAATHPFTWQLKGTGILEFDFDNILLPDSTTNEEASHCSVTYTIRPLSTVPLLTVIPNYASIYFDFNAPVNTNTITSVIDVTVGVNEINNHHAISIIPNPASNLIKVLLVDEWQSDHYTLKIFNLQGQNVMRLDNVIHQQIISLAQLASGCYFYCLEKDGNMIEHSQGKIILNK